MKIIASLFCEAKNSLFQICMWCVEWETSPSSSLTFYLLSPHADRGWYLCNSKLVTVKTDTERMKIPAVDCSSQQQWNRLEWLFMSLSALLQAPPTSPKVYLVVTNFIPPNTSNTIWDHKCLHSFMFKKVSINVTHKAGTRFYYHWRGTALLQGNLYV